MEGSKLFSNNRLILGVAWSQAGRDHMQDAFSLSLSCSAKKSDLDFFGVFDGHGPQGESISRQVACSLCEVILKYYTQNPKNTLPQSIEMGCLILDSELRKDPEVMSGLAVGNMMGGCCCCAVWLMNGCIYSGNLGDSRFVLSYSGKAVAVTVDHKPSSPTETARIVKAGGFVENDRVNGILGVARAFGDFNFKDNTRLGPHEQLVTALPEVRTVDIDDKIDFLVIATDGVWDIMANQEVIDFVVKRMERNVSLEKIALQLVKACKLPINPLTNLGSDNMTVIIAVMR